VIRVIGNSHLGYQFKLKKIFGNSKIIASNKKFMIIDAMKMD
jgi:16S rRNA G1207 methylase RsmC